MNVAVERTSPNEAVVTAEVAWAEIEKASDKAYKRLAQQYNVPGFRKGHVPRSILEQQIGSRAIYSEALNDVVDDVFHHAVEEHHLVPVAQPTMDSPEFEQGQPFNFTLKIPVQSEVVVGDYSTLKVPVEQAEVSDEEVQTVVDRMQTEATTWEPVDRPAQVEDKVTVDLKLTINDKVVNDLKDHEFELTIERTGIYAGLDDHIVGLKEGDTAQFTTTVPEDYGHPEYAGKEAHYDITVKAVKQKVVPELDDEFAKERAGLENMETVRTVLHDQLMIRKQMDHLREHRDNVVQALLDASQVEPHQSQVDSEIELMLAESKRALESSGLSLEQYLEITKKTEDEYKAEFTPEALRRVRRDLVLSEIADRENIQVSDAEMQDWLNEYTSGAGRPLRVKALTSGQRANVRGRIRRDKALELVVEAATLLPEGEATRETGEETAPSVGAAASAEQAAEE